MGEKRGLLVKNYFSRGGDPYSPKTTKYSERDIIIKDEQRNAVETIKGAVFPDSWSYNASDTAATKYFRREGVPETGREVDVRQLVGRVAKTISRWGAEQDYIPVRDMDKLNREIAAVSLGQIGAYNSPIWFNLGLDTYGLKKNEHAFYVDHKTGKVKAVENYFEHPQGSACFIVHPEDSIEDMMKVAALFSSRLFKGGSGIGSSWYRVRSAGEPISGGGKASGAKRFMDVQDSVARVIKSGGITRRAASLQNLPVWHPDMLEVIRDKYQEEQKAKALIASGSPSNWEGHTIQNLRGQNVNISVLCDDEFWKACETDSKYSIKRVTDGAVVREVRARDLLEQMAFATHECGDPGIQNFTTINKYNTCKNSGLIYGSNPCSEYLFLDDSACNLASINLMKFRKSNGGFDAESFFNAVDLFIATQDILVSELSYPSEEITWNSHIYRPLGLGYANLGALLMSLGMPYDSDQARAYAAAITAAMTSRAYLQSSKLAEKLGPFSEYEKNKEPMREVLELHRNAAREIPAAPGLEELIEATKLNYDRAIRRSEEFGFRNAQVTLLAPTGTIGFMMGCDTTGCEPDLALKKYKTLAGGGFMKIVNETVPLALKRLGYTESQIKDITDYIDKEECIERAPGFKEEHLPIFDCSMVSGKSERAIDPMGHIKMLGALQPHLSGGISKTVNCPESTSVEEIADIFYQSWKLGVKAVAIYRDGSKASQPVKTKKHSDTAVLKRGEREHMPNLRIGLTQKVKIGDVPLFFRTGEYPDGRLGEIWIDCLRRGSEVNGLLNIAAIEFSEKLQGGIPLGESIEVWDKYGLSQIGGFTDHEWIKSVGSFGQFIYRWVGSHYAGDISFLFDSEGKPIQPEMRPLPEELRAYQQMPKLHLIPSVAGTAFYEGVPTLEETIKRISGTNYWCDEGLDTRKTIEKIKSRRQQSKNNNEGPSKKFTGKTCDACGSLMTPDGNCWKCPVCMKAGGCGG